MTGPVMRMHTSVCGWLPKALKTRVMKICRGCMEEVFCIICKEIPSQERNVGIFNIQ